MARSRWDRALGLAWVAYGATEVAYDAYRLLRISTHVHVRGIELVPLLPNTVILLLLVVGGAGMTLGRKWAWILTPVLSLPNVALSAFVMRALAFSIWPLGFDLPAALEFLLPTAALWCLAAWTVVRVLVPPKPWQSRATIQDETSEQRL